MIFRRSGIMIAMLCLLASPARARQGTDSANAFFSIHADGRPLRVYIDTAELGTTPLDSVPVRPGLHLLRCMPLDSLRWAAVFYSESLAVAGGEQIRRTIPSPEPRRIESCPFGAQVLVDGRPAGETPLEIMAGGTMPIAFSRHYYESGSAMVGGDTLLVLTALRGLPDAPRSPYLSEERFRNPAPIYLTAGAAILTGAAAAYFKLKADGEYADYRLNGTPGALEEVHRNDNRAGVALVLCQVNLLGLAYLLFSR
jgi:hypothetical protein